MTRRKIMYMVWHNHCRTVLVKELTKFDDGTRKRLYVVSELPFFDNDDEMKLRGDMIGQVAFESIIDAQEEFQRRTTEPEKEKEDIENLIKKFLMIDTLEVRNSDRLDFHDLHISNIKEVVKKAYQLGKDS